MSKFTQIAFQLDNASLAEVDRLVGGEFPSRAGVIRAAVQEWLAVHRDREIDAKLAAGYGVAPEGPETDRLAALSVEGLASADLGW